MSHFAKYLVILKDQAILCQLVRIGKVRNEWEYNAWKTLSGGITKLSLRGRMSFMKERSNLLESISTTIKDYRSGSLVDRGATCFKKAKRSITYYSPCLHTFCILTST